jgi:hypothetical protein
MAAIEERKVYEVGGRLIVHVPRGRGEELRLHLESHGIESRVSQLAEGPFERLEIEGYPDREVVQAILDQWER